MSDPLVTVIVLLYNDLPHAASGDPKRAASVLQGLEDKDHG